jgi:hypothetical protein
MNKLNITGIYQPDAEVLICKRNSGVEDVFPVKLAAVTSELHNKEIWLNGQVQPDHSILVEDGEAYGVAETKDIGVNYIEIEGTITKIFPVRTTKKDHKLQDLIVDGLKVVAFEPCPDFIVEGIKVRIKGRYQSRTFTQKGTFGDIQKTVYEVALKNCEVL